MSYVLLLSECGAALVLHENRTRGKNEGACSVVWGVCCAKRDHSYFVFFVAEKEFFSIKPVPDKNSKLEDRGTTT